MLRKLLSVSLVMNYIQSFWLQNNLVTIDKKLSGEEIEIIKEKLKKNCGVFQFSMCLSHQYLHCGHLIILRIFSENILDNSYSSTMKK